VTRVLGFSVWGLAGRTEAIQMELDPHVNIIWGYNGSGKTSLLKILSAAMSNRTEGLDRVPFASAEVRIESETFGPVTRSITKSDVTIADEDPDLFTEAMLEDSGDPILVRYGSRKPPTFRWHTKVGKGIRAADVQRLHHTYLPVSRLVSGLSRFQRVSSGDAIDDDLFDQMFVRQVNQRWQMYNSESLARIRDIQQQGLGEILSLLFGGVGESRDRLRSSSVEADEAYSLVRDYLRTQNIRVTFNRSSFAQRYSSSAELQAVVTRIGTITDSMVSALAPQRDFRELIDDLFGGVKHVALDQHGIHVQVGDREISLQSLSSGERQLLQILLLTLSGRTSSVIVDEPELSMHVDWQLRLVESMRLVNPECQLVLATHSPEVMARVGDKFIHQL
jgi:predicted ATPase